MMMTADRRYQIHHNDSLFIKAILVVNLVVIAQAFIPSNNHHSVTKKWNNNHNNNKADGITVNKNIVSIDSSHYRSLEHPQILSTTTSSTSLFFTGSRNKQNERDNSDDDERYDQTNDNANDINTNDTGSDLIQVIQNLEQDQDFSSWMEGLGQWPKYPKKFRKDDEDKDDEVSLDNDTDEEDDDDEDEDIIMESTKDSSSTTTASTFTDGVLGWIPDAADIFAAVTSNNSTNSDKDTLGASSSSSQSATEPEEDTTSFLSLPPLPLQLSLKEPRPTSVPGKYRGRINPLSNFIQFEAILDLAAGVNNETEPYFNSVFAAADQLFKLSKEQQQLERQNNVKATMEDKEQFDKNEPVASMDVETTLSNFTTVEDLLQQERKLGGLPFQLDKLWGFTSTTAATTTTTSSSSSSADSKVKTSPKTVQVDSAELRAAASKILPDDKSSNSMDMDSMLSTVASTNSSAGLAQAAESLLKDTTSSIEDMVTEASSTFSPASVQQLVIRASRVFGSALASTGPSTSSTANQFEAVSNEIVRAAQRVAKESGVDVQFAADRAREATKFAASMASVANIVFGSGYAYGSRSGASGIEGYPLYEVFPQVQQATTPPLFGAYKTAERIEPYQYENVVIKGAEMGILAGAIYEDTVQRCHKLGHALVANGTVANVAWMVTDSIDYESRYTDGDTGYNPASLMAGERPMFVRTITFRGFDASDDTVDREALLNDICTASPVPLDDATADKVLFHSGLLSIAKQVYKDIKTYIDWVPPRHKIVLNGHSVGGSLSILVLLLMASERGVDYVRDRIKRVYSHGSPPVATMVGSTSDAVNFGNCPVLNAFELPSDLVYGYVQPYDPVVRLFTNVDALYPLVDDLGKDELTLYATGPRRSLRPIVRAIFASWEGWPRFRENWKGTNQRYQSVGTQHLLMPEPLRYLNDRFFSVNIGVPPTEVIIRLSSTELLPALNTMFPLDVFQISLIPQAVRSFLHHFYPAYDSTIADYAAKVTKQARQSSVKKRTEGMQKATLKEVVKPKNQKAVGVLAEANGSPSPKKQ
ncbi:lipase class 3 [Nitzschia inconspicua]|uniref:Lipase class 3 n=1 Tax=Nitzschia inconspicua TaxID=303405 RepID=A0A9K3Q7B9_9STRA|nr:lipase class 3 [Nitzschia inconspicua]